MSSGRASIPLVRESFSIYFRFTPAIFGANELVFARRQQLKSIAFSKLAAAGAVVLAILVLQASLTSF